MHLQPEKHGDFEPLKKLKNQSPELTVKVLKTFFKWFLIGQITLQQNNASFQSKKMDL